MSPRRQKGFSLVTALFVMVVLAALGGFMVSMSTAEHRTATSSALGARAYYAARSGVEWGAGRAIAGSCAEETVTFDTFNVAITCASSSHTEASSYNVYTITATATSSGAALGNPNYVSRTVALTITDYLPP